jgi:hypothetical protein
MEKQRDGLEGPHRKRSVRVLPSSLRESARTRMGDVLIRSTLLGYGADVQG